MNFMPCDMFSFPKMGSSIFDSSFELSNSKNMLEELKTLKCRIIIDAMKDAGKQSEEVFPPKLFTLVTHNLNDKVTKKLSQFQSLLMKTATSAEEILKTIDQMPEYQFYKDGEGDIQHIAKPEIVRTYTECLVESRSSLETIQSFVERIQSCVVMFLASMEAIQKGNLDEKQVQKLSKKVEVLRSDTANKCKELTEAVDQYNRDVEVVEQSQSEVDAKKFPLEGSYKGIQKISKIVANLANCMKAINAYVEGMEAAKAQTSDSEAEDASSTAAVSHTSDSEAEVLRQLPE